MRFDDDYNNRGNSMPVLYMAFGVSIFILVLLGVILFINRDNKKSAGNYQMLVASRDETAAGSEDTTPVHEVGKITADDLDIWDMYQEGDDEGEIFVDAAGNGEEVSVAETKKEPTPTPAITPKTEEETYDDGLHFKVELSDGSSEWLKIDTGRQRNNYDFTNAQIVDGKMRYIQDGREVSRVGIDVSRYQGDIDFTQVKNSGIQFVMIRVGARGYQSGQLSLDENFEKNIKAATEAGLDVGVYFYSQAVNAFEAVEECNVVRTALTDHPIKYPVAFVCEGADNDTARTDNLSKDDRTQVAITFLNTMKSNGYKVILYGTEEWLVKKYDWVKLKEYSIWLADDSEIPDYPYPYQMLRYSTTGSVPGIVGNVNMDISFIDYTAQ